MTHSRCRKFSVRCLRALVSDIFKTTAVLKHSFNIEQDYDYKVSWVEVYCKILQVRPFTSLKYMEISWDLARYCMGSKLVSANSEDEGQLLSVSLAIVSLRGNFTEIQFSDEDCYLLTTPVLPLPLMPYGIRDTWPMRLFDQGQPSCHCRKRVCPG